MRDPYKPKRDHSRLGVGALIAGLLILAVLTAVYVLRPTSNQSEQRAEAALERQMDNSQAASADRQRDIDAERAASFR